MNIEEKAKAYDEALEKARRIKNGKGDWRYSDLIEIGPALTEIFPELRENEDERVRKAALEGIEYLEHNLGWDAIGDIDILDVKEYLEKQKERGPLTKEEKYILHRVIEYLEDETCPSEWISLLHDIYCLPYEKQKEQKPAEWSEEDEKIVNNIVSVLGQYIDYKAVSGTSSGYATPRYAKEIDWLKSLRPSWKPSEEQMEALKRVAYNLIGTGTETDIYLVQLYEQLKKL